MARNVKQYQRPVTGLRARRVLLGVTLFLCAALIAGVLIWRNTRPYTPPAFDETARQGEPQVPDGLGYGVASAPSEDGFSVGVASVWKRAEDGSLPVWLTNPAENRAYLLMRVTDAGSGKILYESGMLRPGEYVEALQPLRKLPDGPVSVQVAVYSLDPENYRSLGTLRMSGAVE